MTSREAAIGHAVDQRSRRMRRFCIAFLYVLAAFWGVAQIVGSGNEAIYFSTVSLFALTATFAAIEDSRLCRVHFVNILRVLFLVTLPVSALVYMLLTRGWRGLGWWFVHAIGLFATMCFTFYPTLIVLYSLNLVDPTVKQ